MSITSIRGRLLVIQPPRSRALESLFNGDLPEVGFDHIILDGSDGFRVPHADHLFFTCLFLARWADALDHLLPPLRVPRVGVMHDVAARLVQVEPERTLFLQEQYTEFSFVPVVLV